MALNEHIFINSIILAIWSIHFRTHLLEAPRACNFNIETQSNRCHVIIIIKGTLYLKFSFIHCYSLKGRESCTWQTNKKLRVYDQDENKNYWLLFPSRRIYFLWETIIGDEEVSDMKQNCHVCDSSTELGSVSICRVLCISQTPSKGVW